MIIDEENIRVQYESTAESPIVAGDVLPFPYRFTEKEQLNAVLLDGTKLIYKQDYTVGETSITLSVDIPIGDTITIYRSTPLDQGSEFPQEAKFNSKKIEDALDKLTMQNQEQREALGRALKLPLTASTDLSDLALPNPDPNKSVKWNADGTALVNTDFDPDLALALTENFKNQAQQAAIEAENQRNVATEQATIATQQAGIATEKTTEVAQAKEEAVTIIKDTETNSLTKINSEFNKANEWFEKLNAIPYIPVGTILPTTGAIDESLGYQRYANGQLIANVSSQAPDLVKFLEFQEAHAPNLLCSETEWQTALTLSTLGQVGKYVWNKEEDSIRIPRIVNIQGMMDMNTVGNMIEAGLPNVWAYFGSHTLTKNSNSTTSNDSDIRAQGMCKGYSAGSGNTTATDMGNKAAWFMNGSIEINASYENPIYGRSDTVQEESILYPYVLQIATGVQYKTPVQNELERIVPYSFGNHKYSNVLLNNPAWVRSVGQWNSAKTHGDYYNWLVEERRNPKDIPARANVTKVGNVIDKGGVLSGFSNSSYATIDAPNGSINSFELVFKITTSNDISTYQTVLGQDKTNIHTPQINVPNIDSGKIRFSFPLGTNSWSNIDTSFAVQANTDYWLKMVYDGSNNIAYYSMDGRSFTQVGLVVNSSGIQWDEVAQIGADQTNNSFLGSVDLKECYININGSRWWSGIKSKVRLHTEDYGPEDWVINQSEQTFRLPLVADRVLVDKAEGTQSYDLYSDGYLVQQGNLIPTDPALANAGSHVHLQKAYKDMTYRVSAMQVAVNTVNSIVVSTIWSTSHFGIAVWGNKGYNLSWQTSGYAEIPTEEQRTMNKYLYFYVGGVAKNEHLVDVGRIEEKFVDKVDTNASNFTAEGIRLISGYSMPSEKYVDLAFGASGTTYTAPDNGWFYARGGLATNANAYHEVALAVGGTTVTTARYTIASQLANGYATVYALAPVKKGQQITLLYYTPLTRETLIRFFYAEG